VEDPFAWLIERDNPDTIAYLTAENQYCDEWFAPHAATIEKLFTEIKSRVREDDTSVPVRRGQWWYASRTKEGLPYAIHTRGTSIDHPDERVLIDENVEAGDSDYFSLNAFDISHNDEMLAWSSDTDGSEKYTLRIRNISTGLDMDDVIPNTTWGGTAWSANNEWLFYVVPDEAMRPWQVWRHKVGTPTADDILVFEDADERFFVGVDISRSQEWIIIETSSRTSSEAWLLRADSPTAPLTCVRPRTPDVEYQVDHWGDMFAIVTNENAPDFKVVTAPVSAPDTWTDFVPHEAGSRVMQFDCFSGFAVLHRWRNAQQEIVVVGHDGTQSLISVLDEPHELELDSNPNFVTDELRINYQSLTTPHTVADYTLSTGALMVRKQTEVPNATLGDYVSSRVWASATDGTKVPLDIVHHKNTGLNSTAPVLLYGYGSYEASMAPWFSPGRLSLLDRGWVWALAHPRGGGEMGRNWYLDGKLLNKRNTFTDTIACAKHIASSGIGRADGIVIRGGSAGGLLVGACVTMEPSAFAGVIAEVPFVDVVSTMSDPSLPLTVTEWEEWGDPRVEPWASYMESYSPYDNTLAAAYPPIFVTAGLNDPRVSYHEPAKWVARLRHVAPESTVILKCEMGAGHGGPSGRYDRWRDEARTLAFALWCVEINR
jgi:oligopeptidase B